MFFEDIGHPRGGEMKKNVSFITVVTLIAVLLAVLLPNLIVNQTVFAKGESSTIAGIDVSGLKEEELVSAIQDAVTKWTSEPIIVTGGGMEVSIDPSILTFDVQGTIESYKVQVEKPWYAFWRKTPIIHIPLQVTASEELKSQIENVSQWKFDETYNQVIAKASYLKGHEVEAVVEDLSFLEEERIALSMETIPKDAIGVADLVSMLDNLVINPDQTVSLLETFGQYADVANQEAQDFVASLVYHTVLQTDYEIIERSSQKRVPTYLQAGFEASVDKSQKLDLQFVNHSEQPSKYSATIEGSTLKLELTAQVAEVTATPRVRKDKIVKPKIITRYSPKLLLTQQKVIQNGEEGLRVFVYRSISKNGSLEEELVSRDYYPPVNRIVMKSSREPITTTGTASPTPSTTTDSDLQMDLDGDGLPDENSTGSNLPPSSADNLKPGEKLPDGSYYDKGGNLVKP